MAVMCMRACHLTGVFRGTGSSTPQADVTLEPSKNCFVPVEGNCGRFVYRLWCGFRVDMKLQWWTVLQQRKGLVLADIES